MQRLAQPGDTIIGQACDAPFPDRRFVPVPKTVWPPFDRAGRYAAGVARVLRDVRPDLVEIHNRPNLALSLARVLPNTKLALFLHNDPLAMRQATKPAQRAAIAHRMAVICPSAYLSDRFMENLTAGTPRPMVLPNTLDRAALPPRLPPQSRDKTILFVGRVVADKGADAFVRAWAAIRDNLPGWRAKMIGADRFFPNSPDSDFIRALRPLAEQCGIDMRGYLPHADTLREMARAAIVAVPSRWPEPFGLAALEAMGSGAALVCGPTGGLPELAGQAALYAHPDTPGALEQALLELAENPPRRAALAQAGLDRATAYESAGGVRRLLAMRAALRARMG